MLKHEPEETLDDEKHISTTTVFVQPKGLGEGVRLNKSTYENTRTTV